MSCGFKNLKFNENPDYCTSCSGDRADNDLAWRIENEWIPDREIDDVIHESLTKNYFAAAAKARGKDLDPFSIMPSFECPFCSDEGLDYADEQCFHCDARIADSFWHEIHGREYPDDQEFVQIVAYNELAVCCLEHERLCTCLKEPVLLESLDQLAVEDGIREDDIWDESCRSCEHRNTNSCLPWIDWLVQYSELREAPNNLSICDFYDPLDGFFDYGDREPDIVKAYIQKNQD